LSITDSICFIYLYCMCKSLGSVWYGSLVCSPRLHQKYSKNTNILKYYYNLKEQFSIVIYSHLKDY